MSEGGGDATAGMGGVRPSSSELWCGSVVGKRLPVNHRLKSFVPCVL